MSQSGRKTAKKTSTAWHLIWFWFQRRLPMIVMGVMSLFPVPWSSNSGSSEATGRATWGYKRRRQVQLLIIQTSDGKNQHNIQLSQFHLFLLIYFDFSFPRTNEHSVTFPNICYTLYCYAFCKWWRKSKASVHQLIRFTTKPSGPLCTESRFWHLLLMWTQFRSFWSRTGQQFHTLELVDLVSSQSYTVVHVVRKGKMVT